MGRKKKDANSLGRYVSDGKASKRRKEETSASFGKRRDLFAPDAEELIEHDTNLASIYENDQDEGEITEACIRHIWQAIEGDRILLGYAITGYDWATGKPVYDYDVMVDLLINYGYRIGPILVFMDEFANSIWPDGTKRIVVNSSHRVDIHRDIEPLPDIPCD